VSAGGGDSRNESVQFIPEHLYPNYLYLYLMQCFYGVCK
jgi:hypothetical protein